MNLTEGNPVLIFSAKKIIAYSGALLLAACASSNTGAPANGRDHAATRDRASRSYDELDEQYSTTKDSGSMSKASTAEVEKSKAALKKFSCPEGAYLRGEAFDQSEAAALQLAQKNIANQIHSSIISISSQYKSQVEDAAGREQIQSGFEVTSKVFSQLENAQDARKVGAVEVGDKVGVVACMAVEDAMKPFNQQFANLQDSLTLLSETFNATDHPMKKMDAYRTGRDVHNRLVAVRNVLESFKYPVDGLAEKTYNELNENFRQFKSHYHFYFNGNQGDELEQALFGRLSQNYNLVSGECNGGVVLSVESSSAECKDGSLGMVCQMSLTLKGASCGGDTYFVLRTPVKGVGRYGKNDAMDRIVQNISKGDWFNVWADELNKWNAK
ncbi:MAG: hypothetical protein MJY87_07660 [Fibrobacter sp.]|nr:hypothetical protein [Fibrobacter sp.]